MVKLYVCTLALIVSSTVNAVFRGESLLEVEEQDGVTTKLVQSDEEPVHVNCRVSPWGPWEPCDPLTGKQTRTRLVEALPRGRGKACPYLEQTIPCKAHHCKVSKWSPWEDCNEDGFRIRTREILQAPVPGGRPCPHLVDRKKCRSVDCLVCHWSEWGVCDQETGIHTRTRESTRQPEFGGAPCPPLIDQENCPVDCVVDTNFGPWSDCVDGVMHRIKPITRSPRNDGKACPPEEDRTEYSDVCPIDCVLASCDNVEGWSECDEDGNKYATRGIAIEAKNGGHCPAEADRQCHGICPPIDCEFDGWQEWSECDEDGKKERKRILKTAPKYHGKPCEDPWTEYGMCPAEDCEMEEWGVWGECIEGVKIHTRGIKKAPKYHGQECGPTEEEAPCPVDCVVDTCENSQWTECNVDGIKSAIRAILVPARNGGNCPNEAERTCHDTCPPVDCVMDEWSAWSECHYGTKSRSRAVKTPPQYHGQECENDYEEAPCTDADCVVSDWKPWGECDENGKRHRTRDIIKNCDERQHGEQCPPLEESEQCVPVDCVVSNWSGYGPCDDAGWRTRTRTITTPAQNGGQACPNENQLVDRQECPKQDCVPDAWQPFGPCSETPPYTKTRTRGILVPAKYGGQECVLTESQTCPAINCVTSEWGQWTECDEDTGVKSRTKTIITPAQYGGRACPRPSDLIDYGLCPKVDCKMSSWSSWSNCVNHRRTRTRTIVTPPRYGGDECGSTTQSDWC